jgi:release factor glutamine methyltransferase
MTTVKDALAQGYAALKEMESAQIDAEILLCHILKKTRSYLYAHGEIQLTPLQLMEYQHFISKKIAGMPTAYLIGKREFWSLDLRVTPDTLIPRPETEYLVEAVLKHLADKPNASLLDLGTGSGAIALALASEQPGWQILATDKSEAALAVAKENASALKLNNVSFLQSDWFSNLPNKQFDAILSNPPYIAKHDSHLQQNGLPFEPQEALVASQDGLADLFHLIEHAPDYLKPGGALFLEHGYDQASRLKQQFIQCGYQQIQFVQDAQHHDRVAIAIR